MKKLTALLLAVAVGVFSGVGQQLLSLRDGMMDNLAFVRYVPGDGVVAAQIFDDAIRVSFADSTGRVKRYRRIPTKRDGLALRITDAAVDADGVLYLLEDLCDPITGEWQRQEFELYDLHSATLRRIQTHRPEEMEEPALPQSDNASGASAASAQSEKETQSSASAQSQSSALSQTATGGMQVASGDLSAAAPLQGSKAVRASSASGRWNVVSNSSSQTAFVSNTEEAVSSEAQTQPASPPASSAGGASELPRASSVSSALSSSASAASSPASSAASAVSSSLSAVQAPTETASQSSAAPEQADIPVIAPPVDDPSVPVVPDPAQLPKSSQGSASEETPVTHVVAASDEDASKVRYRWISAGSSILLMGTTNGGETLVRDTFDAQNLRKPGGMVSKMTRLYPLDTSEGIFACVPQGTDVIYTSRSGKVFFTSDAAEKPREVYPARELERLMYPLFLAQGDSTGVIIGEQESGDILRLDTASGQTVTLKQGTEPFSGISSYAPVDLLSMSMQDIQNFCGVVQNQKTLDFELIVSQQGASTVVTRLTPSLGLRVLECAAAMVLGGIAAAFLWLLLRGLWRQLHQSRTILAKLAFSAIPMLMLALFLFGGYSYISYRKSIYRSFEKQVIDEGNLLTALFGSESFGEIEFPYDYSGEAYGYLSNQMKTRKIVTRTAYYERNTYYTGVDAELPPFYPFGVNLSRDSAALYRQATLTGQAVTGIITDRYGKRMSCVTPIGGVSGATVYLLETGIYLDQVTQYTKDYLSNYILIATAFVLGISAVLLLSFKSILRPLLQIKRGMEAFSKGERDQRLESETGDEFSDITRVFNKMADDIDAQIYNLKGVSDNYFRFIPPRIFRLLGKENLGELSLGSSVEGRYAVLTAVLRTDAAGKGEQENIDHFFGMVNRAAGLHDGTLITDSVDLRRLRVIVQDAQAGVRIAIAALAQMGTGQNSGQMLFLLHEAQICYRICGDEERYIPAIISDEMRWLDMQLPFLEQLACRFVVTQSAADEVKDQQYARRMIGNLSDSERTLGIYEFYDANPPEQTRLIANTRPMFDKAMELYQSNRYYDAKNLFAMVLRENPSDNAARHYLFVCEQQIS